MTVVLRKNFYTIYTFLVQRLECHFCRYPLYQITNGYDSMMVVFAKTLVFRHFRGRPCVKANKFIA